MTTTDVIDKSFLALMMINMMYNEKTLVPKKSAAIKKENQM